MEANLFHQDKMYTLGHRKQWSSLLPINVDAERWRDVETWADDQMASIEGDCEAIVEKETRVGYLHTLGLYHVYFFYVNAC